MYKLLVAFSAAALFSAPLTLQAQTVSSKTKVKTAAGTTKTKESAPAPAARPTPAPPTAKVEERASALTANMQKALGLTPQQTEKVQQINLTSVRNVETVRLKYRSDLRKMAALIDDIGQSRLSSLKDVLTPQQFDRYQRKREEKMGVPNVTGTQGTPAPGLPGNYGE
ncbi:hypothetical protein [Hymenobacter sp. BT730]|uniref:hypothetical protein n=1 Tax=Hymenobacter sp. BT730 TaxID=3063332 RepID=UPI0026DF5199|nr:hypothetical protein [Hymenobacter sp. BT730]